MLARLRSTTFAALASKKGDRLLPLRLGKKAALYLNDLAGRPLADSAELERRAEFDKRGPQPTTTAPQPEQVPVVLFHAGDGRDLRAMAELLDEAEISYDQRDIEEDLPTREAVARDSGSKRLPVLFVAGTVVGGLSAVRTLAESGELARLIDARDPEPHDDGGEAALGDDQRAAQVYGDDSCGWTDRSRALLDREGIAYQYVDLRAMDAPTTRDHLERETGHYTQPWIFVRGRFVGGYNALHELARLGQLQTEASDTSSSRIKVVVAERENSDEVAPGQGDPEQL